MFDLCVPWFNLPPFPHVLCLVPGSVSFSVLPHTTPLFHSFDDPIHNLQHLVNCFFAMVPNIILLTFTLHLWNMCTLISNKWFSTLTFQLVHHVSAVMSISTWCFHMSFFHMLCFPASQYFSSTFLHMFTYLNFYIVCHLIGFFSFRFEQLSYFSSSK